MALPNKIQGAFTGGELAPALWGRPDLAKYSIGAKTLRNAFVQVEGGGSNRSGTRYAFELGENCYFIPFEFNQSQTAQLVFYDGKIMFLQGGQVVVTNLVSSSDGYEWKASPANAGEYYFQKLGDASPGIIQPKALYEDGVEMPAGTIGALAAGQWVWGDNDSLGFDTLYVKVTGGGDPDAKADGWLQMPYVIESPYAIEDLPSLRFAQQYDTLVLACRGYKQRQLVRYDYDDWRWEAQEIVGGPLGPINSDKSKVIDIAIENWSSDRNYTPGEVVRPASVVNATASWIGTIQSFERNTTIKGDLTTSAIPSGERYYSSSIKLDNFGYELVYYPFTFIRIAKSSGLAAGDQISISLTFIEVGGASAYSSSGTINNKYSGTSYDYISVNFGWKYRSSITVPYETECIPRGLDSPDDPDGLTYPVATGFWGEYEHRIYCLQIGTNEANGGGAMVSAVSGNLQKISGGAAAYESIAPSNDIEPGIDTGWALFWRSIGSIPAEVINVEITASGHAPFDSNQIGVNFGLSDPDIDRTMSYQWVSAGSTTVYSDEIMVLGEVTMWTEKTWKGKLHLELSTDQGKTWEESASIHSKNLDHNGTLVREIVGVGTLVRMKFEPGGGGSSDYLYAYLRAESTFTHVLEITHFHSDQKAIGRLVYGDAAPFSTTLWSWGVFGESPGYPNTVTIHQARMIYGGTVSSPKNLWGSRTGDYTNFASSDLQLATEPINAEVSLAKQYEIRHLVPLKSLLILTSGSWHSLAGSDGSLTPTNGDMTLHGYGGVSDAITPLVAGLSVLCVQDDDRTISELRYSLASDGFDRTEELAIFSKHLFRGKTITGWAYQKDPNDLVWVTMSDGTLLSFTFLREQEIWAWTRHDTAGEFLRVGSVKSSAGGDDEVYFLVKRNINGADRYFIEYLTPRLPDSQIEDGVFMDCSISYEGSPATVIQGLEHLEGAAVAVLADGKVIPGHTVSGGQITLAAAASKVHVGLAYSSDIETLNLELGESTTSQGRKKAVRKVVLRCQDTKGFRVGPSVDKLTVPNEWDKLAAGELFSGDIEHRIKGDWNTEGSVFIRQSDPLPMTINAVIPFFELGE